MKSAFTIVAKNYIGLAKVLRDSLHKHNKDVKFYIFVADESDESYKGEDGVYFARYYVDICSEKWIDMAFKYSLTEFCTAIKPFCFQFLFQKEQMDTAIYFDPDIYIFNKLDYFDNLLDKYSIVLVPHIVYPNLMNDDEKTFLQSGIYNLGFLALKNSETSIRLLEWWGAKLLNSCFDDVLDYTFTDQKWMNFVPAMFLNEEVYVSRYLGANIAPWNFYEREMIFQDNAPSEVYSRNMHKDRVPILFIHFSGFDYSSLLLGTRKRTRYGSYQMKYGDVADSINFYIDQLAIEKEKMMQYLSLKYTYATYSNGSMIDKFQRRIYRSLSQREPLINPFDVNDCSFYSQVVKLNMRVTQSTGRIIATQSGIRKNLLFFNKLMRIVYKILGYGRYIALLRFMKYFSRFESQIFLLDNKYDNSNIDLLSKYE